MYIYIANVLRTVFFGSFNVDFIITTIIININKIIIINNYNNKLTFVL